MAKWFSTNGCDSTREKGKCNRLSGFSNYQSIIDHFIASSYISYLLISHASKIMLKILTKRIEGKPTAVNYIIVYWGTVWFTERNGNWRCYWYIEIPGRKKFAAQQNMYICFMDYEKAFDRVNWYKLMRSLVRLGVDWRDRRLMNVKFFLTFFVLSVLPVWE